MTNECVKTGAWFSMDGKTVRTGDLFFDPSIGFYIKGAPKGSSWESDVIDFEIEPVDFVPGERGYLKTGEIKFKSVSPEFLGHIFNWYPEHIGFFLGVNLKEASNAAR
jgi:hypothetical protein